MKANVNVNSVNGVNVKSAINNVLKEEHKSLSSLLKVMNIKKESFEMKEYLNKFNLTFEQLTDINYFKSALKLHTFTASNGEQFESICRTNKDGEIVPAKWSFWQILTAAAKVRREELKKEQRAAKEAKEKSLEAIEKEEKAAKEKTKKTAKKAA